MTAVAVRVERSWTRMPAIENSGNRSGSASDLKLIRGGVIESHKERAGREEGRQDDEPDQKTVRGPDHDLSGLPRRGGKFHCQYRIPTHCAENPVATAIARGGW